MDPSVQTKTTRLEARVSPEARDTLARAAEIQGRSLSDFVVSAALDAAQRVIADTGVIRLSREASEALADQDLRRRVATCFVAVEDGSNAVAGFYTLAAASLVLADLPDDQATKLPRYGNPRDFCSAAWPSRRRPRDRLSARPCWSMQSPAPTNRESAPTPSSSTPRTMRPGPSTSTSASWCCQARPVMP